MQIFHSIERAANLLFLTLCPHIMLLLKSRASTKNQDHQMGRCQDTVLLCPFEHPSVSSVGIILELRWVSWG